MASKKPNSGSGLGSSFKVYKVFTVPKIVLLGSSYNLSDL